MCYDLERRTIEIHGPLVVHKTSFPIENSMKLLIRNLSRTTTESELRAVFEAHGAVQSTNLVLDKNSGGSKGFAFVDMPKAGEAKAAIKHLNGSVLDDNKIRVKKAVIDKKQAAS